MKPARQFAALLLMLVGALSSHGAVVINEIMYNAPDEAGEVEFIELHNTASEPVSLAGWEFTKGLKFKFPDRAIIQANGFLVLCRNPDQFKAQYQNAPFNAEFKEKLSNDGEVIELVDTSKNVVDRVRYQDNAPWPLAADGYSASLERICPNAPGNDAHNWAPSPLSPNRTQASGTPGAQNAAYSPAPPPVIKDVVFGPTIRTNNSEIRVEASISPANSDAAILVSTLREGSLTDEQEVAMTPTSGGKHLAILKSQPPGTLLRFRIKAKSQDGAIRTYPSANEVRPALGVYFQEEFTPAKVPFAWLIQAGSSGQSENRNRSRNRRSRRNVEGQSNYGAALVWYDPATKKSDLFDFIESRPRKAGTKVKFHKDQLLNGISTLNITYENDVAVILEPLSYEVYRRAGMPTQEAFNLRWHENGQPAGLRLAFEQPNKTFLRRNKLNDEGNLYKLLWFGGDVTGQHEKKTNPHSSHEDIIRLVKVLEHTENDPEAQWKVIEQQFDVDQVSTFFAVATVLTHWDGFFNNYFTYHDIKGTGKWTMYPWDQDQTWGLMNGMGRMVVEMPITFGMNGDIPPGERKAPPRDQGFHFGGGAMWWRPPGFFSGPLLANPQFRKIFLAKTREILEKTWNDENFGPILDATIERLKPEVAFQAQLNGEEPASAERRLERVIDAVKKQMKARRAYLLAQDEIKKLPR